MYALYVSWLCVVAPSGSMLGSQILISRVNGPGRPVPVLGPWRGLRVGALAAATESPAPSARRVYASSGAIAGVAANAASLGGMGVSSTPSVAGDAAGVSERRGSGLGEAAARTEMKHRSAVLCGQARVVHSVSERVSTSMRSLLRGWKTAEGPRFGKLCALRFSSPGSSPLARLGVSLVCRERALR